MKNFALVSVALALAGVTFDANTQAVLPDITVTGIRPLPNDWSVTFYPMGGGGYENNSMAWFVQHNQMVQAARVLTDVRCVALGDRSRTTSLADLTDRWLAATDVYQKVYGAAAVIKAGILGTVVSPLDGITYKAFTVVYADGGTEKWLLLPSGVLSAKVEDAPYPNSLKKGDGVIRPSPTGCTSARA